MNTTVIPQQPANKQRAYDFRQVDAMIAWHSVTTGRDKQAKTPCSTRQISDWYLTAGPHCTATVSATPRDVAMVEQAVCGSEVLTDEQHGVGEGAPNLESTATSVRKGRKTVGLDEPSSVCAGEAAKLKRFHDKYSAFTRFSSLHWAQ
jgi:hypothetical protein